MSDCDDIVKEFLAESHENLDRLDREVVELEKHPSDREILASIFRTIHTIKGTSGFLGFGKLESVTHVGESLLARLRDGQLSLNPERTTALLAMVDAVRQMLAEIQATEQDGNVDHTELVAQLTHLQQISTPVASEVDGTTTSTQTTADTQATSDAVSCSPTAVVQVDGVPEQKLAEGASRSEAETENETEEQACEQTGGGEVFSVLPPSGASETKASDGRPREASRDSIRVDVGLLDQLMNLVGELVLARNQILQFTRTTEETNLVTTGQRLNLIATELQESVMKTRMQPIGSVWSRFPRTVRDVAVACGKRVRIQMEGQETELDKTLIEAIKDPMTHLVRNAVDHGIERAEVRAAAGKDPEGLLSLRAYHEGGKVNIEISDDGAGLNLKRVVEKALQKGLISADQAGRMTDRDAVNLVFLPGLSTAEKVTNVSGRGVGMDVVKTNIERIGGTVDLQSAPGQGTTIKVKIPLTLAIVPALIVTCAGQRYAIPQASLLELVGLEGEDARRGLESIHGAPVYRLRGRLLPVVHLREALAVNDTASTAHAEGTAVTGERINIVVLQADGQRFGLVVDDISDTEEIVVKPLGRHLKSISVFAGATIMGDGKVALILDVLGLAQHSHVINEARDRAAADTEARTATEAAAHAEHQAVLLFRLGETGTMAIDLSAVARLEEFERNSIELAGGQETVQYRGQIMPLIRLSDVVGAPPSASLASASSLQVVVVYAGQDRSVGLVVDHILDIVDESFALDRLSARPGIAGSAVIQHRITDILDVPGLIAASPVMQNAACGA